MINYLTLEIYKGTSVGPGGAEIDEFVAGVLKESGMFNENEEGTLYSKIPNSEIRVTLDSDLVHIVKEEFSPKGSGEEGDPVHRGSDILADKTLDEQLSNEFLIQTELLGIRGWDPMRYSKAYGSGDDIAWKLIYSGLKGKEVTCEGRGKYPKKWQMLMDILDAFTSDESRAPFKVYDSAKYLDTLSGGSSAGSTSIVNILSGMGVPQDVIAARIMADAKKEDGFDHDKALDMLDPTVWFLFDRYDTDKESLSGLAKNDDSVYLKKLLLADAYTLLIAERDNAADDESGSAWYATMISELSSLEKDEKAKKVYQKFVDLYKETFVSYRLDSAGGAIYQEQGDTACVMLKRGEYDWKTVEGASKDASPVHKDLALFIAGLWKREADDAIVRDGNMMGTYDVPDIKVLKVAISKYSSEKTKHSENIVKQVLKRMMAEDEQILAAIKAGIKEKGMIEKGEIDDVNAIPVSFLGIEDDDGRTHAAVFTGMDEREEVDEEDITGIPVKMVLEFVKGMQGLDGLMIDPFSDRFIILKEDLAEMLDEVKMVQ